MKKLVIIIASVAIAVASQAATMSWASGVIGLPSGGTATAANVTAKIFLLSASEYATLDSELSGMGAAGVSEYIYENYKDKTSALSPVWSKGSATFKETAKTDYTTGDSAYAVVLYTSLVDAEEYYIGNYASATFASAMNKTQNSMGLKLKGSGDALAWTKATSGDIPEPTSGLLLVLGGAMLVLRRRRA